MVFVRNSYKMLTTRSLVRSLFFFACLFTTLLMKCDFIFRSLLFQNTTCKHPIVMLAGVSASDLEALLEFVYRGEVSVDHSQLPSLLQAAQCLNIQGLAPQTVTHKDDTAYTSIQIHPGLVHQDVKTHILEVGGMVNSNKNIWRGKTLSRLGFIIEIATFREKN
jgi:BTB/POZ domain